MSQIDLLKERIEQLKTKLQSEAVFSEDELNKRIDKAVNRHPKNDLFDRGLTDFPLWLQDKFNTGWSYEIGQYSILSPYPGYVRIWLNKPVAQIEDELSEIKNVIEQQYTAEVNEAKTRLLKELAETNVQIEELKVKQKAQDQYDKKIQKELEKLESELFPTAVINNNETTKDTNNDH